jgi:hypothetical protein
MEQENRETTNRLLRLEQAEVQLSKKLREFEMKLRQLERQNRNLERQLRGKIVVNGK